MAHSDKKGKMEFKNAHIRILDDGSFVLEEMFERKSKPSKLNEPMMCSECERLEYSYENVDDLLKDLGDDLRGHGKEDKSEEGEEYAPETNLKKMMKKTEEDEDE